MSVFFLSPAKVLVILVVAVIVLGPDKLPQVARQIGGLWSDFRQFRHRFESGVRESFPDLPSTDTITRAVRSPLSFLDDLADAHGTETTAVVGEETTSVEGSVEGSVVRSSADENRPQGEVHLSGPEAADQVEPVEPADQADQAEPAGPPNPEAGGAPVPGEPDGAPGGVVHRIRVSGYSVPDDPGLN